MEITEVRVFPVRDNRLRAYVSITIDGCFVIRDLKIIEGDKGLFVAMPARRRQDGTYRDIAHPLNTETRELMEDRILSEYERSEASFSESSDEGATEGREGETESKQKQTARSGD